VQKELAEHGAQLKPVDAMIAGTASELGATLVTRDSDMTRDAVREVLDLREYWLFSEKDILRIVPKGPNTSSE